MTRPKFFNTAGPVVASDHYAIPPLARMNLGGLLQLVQDQRYFVLHAPRQTGKTSALLAFAEELRDRHGMRAVYANIEAAQTARDNVEMGMKAIGSKIAADAEDLAGDPVMSGLWMEAWNSSGAGGCITTLLRRWTQADPSRPAVLMLDEVDALVGDTLVSLLHQLRAGYTSRPRSFPQALVLCGLRDLKDYRIQASDGQTLTAGSCFNIKEASLRLGDFTRAEMDALYDQHTAATGQPFTRAARDLAWELTRGQPWLVNALGRECCFQEAGLRDRSRPVDEAAVGAARERLVLSRATHLDQLAARLELEPRIRRIVVPMLAGEDLQDGALSHDDRQYALDLGLVRVDERKRLAIANPIYREILPRELTIGIQDNFAVHFRPEWCKAADGRMDLDRLLGGFMDFWRKHHAHAWVNKDFVEAECQLVMQAYLQTVVNGGGRIEREYALGMRRTDLFVEWPHPAGRQRFVIEVKTVRPKDGPDAVLAEGLEQTAAYAATCAAESAHLVIFERRPGIAPACTREDREHAGRTVTVWRM